MAGGKVFVNLSPSMMGLIGDFMVSCVEKKMEKSFPRRFGLVSDAPGVMPDEYTEWRFGSLSKKNRQRICECVPSYMVDVADSSAGKIDAFYERSVCKKVEASDQEMMALALAFEDGRQAARPFYEPLAPHEFPWVYKQEVKRDEGA